MSPLAVRGHPTRRNIEEHDFTNAPQVKPRGEVTNAEFRETIRILNNVLTNHVGEKIVDQQEEYDTLRINPLRLTSSSTIKYP